MDNVRVYPDASALAHAAADHFVTLAEAAIKAKGSFSVALSGGNTPRATYSLLATPPFASRVDWPRVHVFWGDERCVPPDHPDSDYRMAKEALLDYVPVSPANVYRIHAENDPALAATEYEQMLYQFFGRQPRFDLVLLGMGDDGHTASLFPQTAALHEQTRWVVENYVDKLGVWRVTFTPPTINAAAHVTFIVSGESKAERLKQVLKGPYQPDELPSQLIKPETGELLWFFDKAAAALL
jgi:6-phosphogluconolactonase